MSASTVDVFLEPELVELLRDEPGLLPLADAIAQTQSRRRRWPHLAAATALVAASAALLLVAPWGSGHEPSLVQKALAAVGNGPVIHAVIESDVGLRSLDLATGRETPVPATTEIWFDQQRKVEHTIMRLDGGVSEDMLQTPTRMVSLQGAYPGARPILDPALARWVDGYREALANGGAKRAGEGTIDGRAVSWLELKPAEGGSERVAIDKQTSKPVRVETVWPTGGRWGYNVLSIESLSEGAGDFTVPTPAKGPQPMYFKREASPIPRSGSGIVVPGAVDLGQSFEGLALIKVLRAKLSTEFHPDAKTEPIVSSGVEFDYGSDRLVDKRPFVWLQEATEPKQIYDWRPGLVPAPGRLLLLGGAGSSFRGTSGLIVRDGVYVTIAASGRELLVAAAKSLAG
jgi:hypothetical protein